MMRVCAHYCLDFGIFRSLCNRTRSHFACTHLLHEVRPFALFLIRVSDDEVEDEPAAQMRS